MHPGHAVSNAAILCWALHLPNSEHKTQSVMTLHGQRLRWSHPQSEKYLRSSGLEWTIVRCTYILQKFLASQEYLLVPICTSRLAFFGAGSKYGAIGD